AFIGELCRTEPVDRIRPGLLSNLHHLVADLAYGPTPAHARPLAIDELHRIFETTFAVYEFAYRRALGAMRTTIKGTVPTRLLADPNAIGNFRRNRAAHCAMRADVLVNGNRCAGHRRWTGLRLAYAGERQRAQGCDTAGGETRSAQKSTTIETII